MNGFRNNIMWSTYLLLIRLWLGYAMITGGQSVLTVFSVDREFFQDWFGPELGFPAPLLMAFLAKGTEFAGGILVCSGLFTRISSSLIAFVMLVATLVANIDYQIKEHLLREDGFTTISCFLFACLLTINGAGMYSLDNIFFRKKFKLI
ncbi:MAG TPA: DoxX family protein [Parafilimonas sp.]|nr:DoxX family protein [Parafilimonas sp.]